MYLPFLTVITPFFETVRYFEPLTLVYVTAPLAFLTVIAFLTVTFAFLSFDALTVFVLAVTLIGLVAFVLL